MRLLVFCSFTFFFFFAKAQHPVAFATRNELNLVKTSLQKFPVLKKSFADVKTEVDAWLGRDVDVPFPKDAAGGYTHDKHKANYILMFNSGLLFNLTNDNRYATLVKNTLMKYAALNPTLNTHPQATSSSPGRIFWQALNDANWLVYAGMAYDLIYNSLTASERNTIEEGAFKPEVDYLTKDLKDWFNLIHNHGVWACAGVGIVGIATGNKDYVDMALYGTEKDGKSGFIAQLNGLFSPDGYYTEGPYYVRYALFPYYLFANALHHAKPGLKIFQHRDSILKKALDAALQQTNINGNFFPVNDAMKEKDYTTGEMVSAINIAWEVYGQNPGWLTVAKKQDRVLLNGGGLSIAKALAAGKAAPHFPYTSVEYVDGAKGNEGGISLLRVGEGANLTTLAFKYASHGLSHGHYDRLGVFLYHKGTEVLQDYGFVRFVGVEQKWGGRYLPENKAYAAQTIAHNTLVVDEKSHFDGKEELAEKHHGEKLFSIVNNSAMQVVSARQKETYPETELKRTLYLLQLPTSRRLMVDFFDVASPGRHQYDLPFQYNGQLISTSFKYNSNTKTLKPLGNKNGYQFLWKEAEATVADTTVQFTYLNGNTFYTISSLVKDSAKVFFTRSGAGDPDFNLRREPSYIIRRNGSTETFINVVEIHGQFDPVAEFTTNSYPAVSTINVVQNDENFLVAEIIMGKDKVLIAEAKKELGKQKQHKVTMGHQTISWAGPAAAWFNQKRI